LLGPLLSAALDNAMRNWDRALTGPVARADVNTVRAHLEVLQERAPQVLPAYLALARRTVDRAAAAGLLSSGDAIDVHAALNAGEAL